jgi:hypothetical protein
MDAHCQITTRPLCIENDPFPEIAEEHIALPDPHTLGLVGPTVMNGDIERAGAASRASTVRPIIRASSWKARW